MRFSLEAIAAREGNVLSAGVRLLPLAPLCTSSRLQQRPTPLPCKPTQEHVGEYGVHWNFFASVAVVELLAHAVRVRPSRLPLLAAAVTAGHQVGLIWQQMM